MVLKMQTNKSFNNRAAGILAALEKLDDHDLVNICALNAFILYVNNILVSNEQITRNDDSLFKKYIICK